MSQRFTCNDNNEGADSASRDRPKQGGAHATQTQQAPPAEANTHHGDNIMAIVDTPLAGKADAESLLLYRKITGN